METMWGERNIGTNTGRVQDCLWPGKIWVVPRQGPQNIGRHLGTGEMQETACPLKSKSCHPVYQGSRKNIFQKECTIMED